MPVNKATHSNVRRYLFGRLEKTSVRDISCFRGHLSDWKQWRLLSCARSMEFPYRTLSEESAINMGNGLLWMFEVFKENDQSSHSEDAVATD